jgi:3-hydroxybutyryl-CoA dehydrogenase
VREIERVGVVGLGTMGAGIAQVCAQAGVAVVGRELTEELVERARRTILGHLDRAVEKGRLEAADRDGALGRLTLTVDLDALAGCDLVIEAALEDRRVKHDLFRELDRTVEADAILATNTSALSVTELAASSRHPERVVGLHFFNPAPVLPLVEVVRTELVADHVFEAAYRFAERIGKRPVACLDTPGFVVNRILVPALNDAVRVLEEGTATAEDIDRAMVGGTSWPIGPLALIDLIGVDVQLHASEALWEAYREPRFAPPPRLRRMLDAGHLGRKSGRGFFEYP